MSDCAQPSTVTGQLSIEVVLCTFNGARYIEEQLTSIVLQTRSVDRVCVFDDGSTDATVALVKAFADKSRVPVLLTCNPQNLGYAKNFSQGLARAVADIVFFSDQDDVWESNKVAEMMPLFDRSECVLVFSDGYPIDDRGGLINAPTVLHGLGLSSLQIRHFDKIAWSQLLRRNVINGAAMAVRRCAALSALPIPTVFPHDYWLAVWLTGRGALMALPDKLYRYRLHDSNLIGARTSKLRHQLYSIYQDPSSPRRQDMERTRMLVDRLPDGIHRQEANCKLTWLSRVAGSQRGFKRTWFVLNSVMRGDYKRYGAPFAMLRDLLGAWR